MTFIIAGLQRGVERPMKGLSQNTAPTRPNVLVRFVARLKLSVRLKLLIAFLGVTCLMTGLAVLGLDTLRKANDRTSQLVADQQRIALFYELDSAFGVVAMMGFAAADIQPDRAAEADITWMQTPSAALLSLVGNLQILSGRAMRTYGREGSPDRAALIQLRAEVNTLAQLANQIGALRRQRNLEAIRILVVDDFAPIALRLQRNTYTKAKQIEAGMARRAQQTSAAYQAARQRVIAAALVAVGLALLLGYAIASSLIWPVRRIVQTLGSIAGGEFDARVSVPNRDELGELASHVNVTSARLGALYDEVAAQRAELASWNSQLEDKVAAQVEVIERTNRLRRFLPRQIAELVVSDGDDADLLRSRRGEVTVLFADLRGFTAFANAVAPEQVIGALNLFHHTVGPLIDAHRGTLERFLGDGLLVLFNAPMQQDDPAGNAAELAKEMQAAFTSSMTQYQAGKNQLGLGIGIATGTATLGQIGFEGRLDYAAIGPAPNLAARLCDQAETGQILLCQVTARQLDAALEPAGPFDLKGIGSAVAAFALT